MCATRQFCGWGIGGAERLNATDLMCTTAIVLEGLVRPLLRTDVEMASLTQCAARGLRSRIAEVLVTVHEQSEASHHAREIRAGAKTTSRSFVLISEHG
jgi:hypothetical protein